MHVIRSSSINAFSVAVHGHCVMNCHGLERGGGGGGGGGGRTSSKNHVKKFHSIPRYVESSSSDC